MPHEAQIYVIDDDEAVRSSLQTLLEAEGMRVSAFESAETFLRNYQPDGAGCAVIDIRLPDMDGFELQRRMAASKINLPVIFITGYGDVPSAVQAIKAGAIEFIEKPFTDTVILDTVRFALRLAAGQASKAPATPAAARLDFLSPRELEVFRYLIAGFANKEIARELQISPRTVEVHRGNLMRKLGARNMMQLAKIAGEYGIEPIDT
jgi:two-component system response regulator FixJ